ESRALEPHIHTSNTQFNHWVNRSRADIHLLWTNTPDGPYPYAGVPWYSTVFGRDGIITALECLWMNPELARGVLNCLAQTQATGVHVEQDAEPGKIIHEMRSGEMAALAEALVTAAEQLRERFEAAFWCEDLSTYALALDGGKRQCRVVTSNAGHCLFAGIASEERAERLAKTLMAQASFSGWGIRTVATNARGYNPMSYHNGSVWPHDNALIAAGLARYRLTRPALKILTGLFDASLFVDLHRLPELFCGFPRRPGKGPTLYPVACSPQSWAAGAVFMLLQACLGLRVCAREKQIRIQHPLLPESLQHV